MTKQELLDQIKADIITNNVCPDLAQNAKNLVFGAGDPNADIIFIGEAPGKHEDDQGEPFVGSAGKFLDEMLADNHLLRSQVYITNIVKYRPPNNRDPEPSEKTVFWPYLLRQISIIQPKIVVTLGRHSMTCFLPNAKISEMHGQPKRIKWGYGYGNGVVGGQGVDGVQGSNEKQTNRTESTMSEARKQMTQQSATGNVGVSSFAGEQDIATLVILPLYHPAAALYNGSLRQTLKEDFKNIMTTINIINKG